MDAFAGHLKGGPSAAASVAGSVPATPSHQRTPASAKRTRSVKSTGAGTKRQKVIKPDPDLEFDDDVDSPEADYSELDTTPTKLKPKVLTTPRKNPPLLPHTAWAKPVDKAAPRPSPVSIAPAPSRPAAPAYTLAPISGVGSAHLPNGFPSPAPGVGYNCAPPVSMASASPSAAHSATMGMTGMRRGSAFSTDSCTAGSSPATPVMAFSVPVSGNGANMVMNNAGLGMAPTAAGMNKTNAAIGTANIMGMPPSNMTPYNMAMFETASSPIASASDTHTPQTNISSNTMAETSFKTEEFTLFGGAGAGNNIGYSANNGNSDDQANYSFDPNEVAFAAEVNFGEFEDDGGWEDNAGEC